MNKKEREKLLLKLSKSSEGQALKDLFEEKIAILNSVEGISNFDEVLGRRNAIQIIRTMMIQIELLDDQLKHKEKSNKKDDYAS